VALGQVFSPSSSVFSCQFHSTGAPLIGKGQKIMIIIIIVITGLHNKPQGCSASVASAAGPFTTKKKPAPYVILRTLRIFGVNAENYKYQNYEQFCNTCLY
jgi:hypothetical protein